MSATFEEAIQPLLDAHAALDADVREKEAELADLKDKRTRLERAVRAVAPERLPTPPKNGHKPKSRADRTRFGEPSLAYVTEYVASNFTGEFSKKEMLRDPAYEGPATETLTHILRHLHETGYLRLLRTGRGGEKFYEVIR